MNREEILAGVTECVAKVVYKETNTINPDDRIIGDLGADSLDLLDLVFQLEQQFSIKLKPRDIERRAQEELGEIPMEENGQFTEAALAQLRKNMPEVPPEELKTGLRSNELPYHFRVNTFVNLVERLIKEQK